MPVKTITPAATAYNYQLLIEHLLRTPLCQAPDQQIVYSDVLRYSYADLGRCVASGMPVPGPADLLQRAGGRPNAPDRLAPAHLFYGFCRALGLYVNFLVSRRWHGLVVCAARHRPPTCSTSVRVNPES